MTRFVLHHSTLLRLAELDAVVAEEHRLLAPTSVRSRLLSLSHERVHRGELTETDARRRLAYVRELRLRLLGDAAVQRRAWPVADELGWPSTYETEYIAPTVLQADDLLTLDPTLTEAAAGFVETAPLAALLSEYASMSSMRSP